MADIDTNYGKTNVKSKVYSSAIDFGTDLFSNQLSKLFGDTEWGKLTGTIFSNGLASAGNTISNNLLKGHSLLEGVPKDIGSTLAGTGAGIVSNYIGQGINSIGGNSMLSRGIGQGVATGLGSLGGTALQAAIKGYKVGNNTLKGIKGASAAIKGMSNANWAGLGMTIAGSALGSAFGPSKEYDGKYGNITQIADTVYDAALGVVGTLGPVGALVSGGMALNKGLSNIFGSTSGMTTQDAILGSAFMGAPIKWLNMANAKTTDEFKNLSFWKVLKANSFMGDAFGDLGDKFNTAREESGKTYGTFSQGAYDKAQKNILFANYAWDKILNMADQNNLQNVRAYDMSSINNLRYAQNILGGWNPIYRGKQGMKIFNNATNHNIGMRLLSGAALIDNKAIILCNAHD